MENLIPTAAFKSRGRLNHHQHSTGQGNNENNHLWLGVTDAEPWQVHRDEGLPGKRAAFPPTPLPGREALGLVRILLGCSQPSLDGIHQACLKSISKGFTMSAQYKIGTKWQGRRGMQYIPSHPFWSQSVPSLLLLYHAFLAQQANLTPTTNLTPHPDC